MSKRTESGAAVVFTHPHGGQLAIGDAGSVEGYTSYSGRDVVVVDLKQRLREADVGELIHHPLSDDVGGLGDLRGIRDLLGVIDDRLRRGKVVHVVCAMGQSRSGTVVANYVAGVLGLEFREGLALIRYRYPDAHPNDGFYARSRDNQELLSGKIEVLDVAEEQIRGWFVNHQAPYL